MPTLSEAWLAEQTAERPPWRQPPACETARPDTGVVGTPRVSGGQHAPASCDRDIPRR